MELWKLETVDNSNSKLSDSFPESQETREGSQSWCHMKNMMDWHTSTAKLKGQQARIAFHAIFLLFMATMKYAFSAYVSTVHAVLSSYMHSWCTTSHHCHHAPKPVCKNQEIVKPWISSSQILYEAFSDHWFAVFSLGPFSLVSGSAFLLYFSFIAFFVQFNV